MISVCAWTAACGDEETGAPADRAPSDPAAMGAFIDSGAYLEWRCQPAPHPATGPSPHGMNRICENELAATNASGKFAVGTTLVKEQSDASGNVFAINVEVRVNETDGASGWLYWRRAGASVTNSGVGEAFCTGCHQGAPRDFVFSRVE